MALFPLGLLSQGGGAGGGVAFEQISTTVVSGGSTTSISFTSIPATYKHLQVRWTARSAWNTTGASLMNVSINGVTSAITHRMQSDGGAVDVTSTAFLSIARIPVATGATSSFGGGVLDILDYSSSNKNKTYRSFFGHQNGANTSNINLIGLWSGTNLSTDVTTSLAFDTNGDAFVAGSRFTLYGIKG
jgi:hypothetical protein